MCMRNDARELDLGQEYATSTDDCQQSTATFNW